MTCGFPVAGQVEEIGRLVTGAVPDQVFLPVARRVLRVLIPVEIGTGKTDADLIDPAVAVDVVREIAKAVAVSLVEDVVSGRANFVHFPVGSLVPDVAGDDVDLAVVIHVEGGHTLRAEGFIEIDPLPMHVGRDTQFAPTRARQVKTSRVNLDTFGSPKW